MALTKITSAGVKDNELVNADLHTAANIAGSKLADGAITEDKIGSVAVVTSKLAPDAVTDTILSDHASNDSLRAVGTNHIKDAAVTNAKIVSMASSKLTGALPAIDGSALTGVSSPEVYGFNTSGSQLQVTTTNGGADNIDAATYASFDDVVFAATGFTFSLDTTTGNLVATI
tara:strand:+ start:1836 stop:2354 length:519 start_codon:yes stop_codon:yes gene_type:complete